MSSAGMFAGHGCLGGNGGSGRGRGGQGVAASAPGISSTGWDATKPVQAATVNGAVAESGTALAAASYCARRVASGADLSHGKTESAQNTAESAPTDAPPSL